MIKNEIIITKRFPNLILNNFVKVTILAKAMYIKTPVITANMYSRIRTEGETLEIIIKATQLVKDVIVLSTKIFQNLNPAPRRTA